MEPSPPEVGAKSALERLPGAVHAGYWSLACLAVSGVSALSADSNRWEMASGGFAFALIGCVLATLAFFRLPQPTRLGHGILTTLAVSAAWSLAVWLLGGSEDSLPDQIGTVVLVLILTSFWLSLILYARFATALAKEQQAHAVARADHHEAQLRLLQAQIKPHFLFNALNTLANSIDENPQRARRILELLADLLRDAFAENVSNTLAAECQRIERYRELLEMRFEDTLAIASEFPTMDERTECPAFLLQPLVENAVQHGDRDSSGVLRVSIRVELQARTVLFEVRNRGSLKPGPRPGTGLANVGERLAVLFGQDASLDISEEHQEVVARVSFPRCIMQLPGARTHAALLEN